MLYFNPFIWGSIGGRKEGRKYPMSPNEYFMAVFALVTLDTERCGLESQSWKGDKATSPFEQPDGICCSEYSGLTAKPKGRHNVCVLPHTEYSIKVAQKFTRKCNLQGPITVGLVF
jgi:hypothetical protein